MGSNGCIKMTLSMSDNGAEIRKIRVACVIPTTGRSELWSRALPSVLSQEEPFDEVIVVADAPASLNPVPGARMLHTGGSRGGGAARAQGFAATQAHWVVFLDDDDEMLPGYCAGLRRRACALPETVGLIVPKVHKVWLEGCIPQGCVRPPPKRSKDGLFEINNSWGVSTFSGLAVRTERFVGLPLDTDLPALQDVSLVQGIAALGYFGVYCEEIRVIFFQYFSTQRVTSDINARLKVVEKPERFGLNLTEQSQQDIILSSILAHGRKIAWNKWLITSFKLTAKLLCQYRHRLQAIRHGSKVMLHVAVFMWLALNRHFALCPKHMRP